MDSNNQNNLSIPIAIVFAGILVAGAVYLTGDRSLTKGSENLQVEQSPTEQFNLDAIREITSEDRVRGDLNAPVVIVEYSDTECPFCKQFHTSMKQIFDEYGTKGQVAWVYRHFPLDQIHRKARIEAHALECAGDLGGNQKFWEYADRLYEITPANDGLDLNELPKIAQYVGLNVPAFNSCLESGKFDDKIEADLQDAIATGGRGTPWSVVILSNGTKMPLSGAQPYSNIKQMIDEALKNL